MTLFGEYLWDELLPIGKGHVRASFIMSGPNRVVLLLLLRICV
jgi:hypothetical protein